VGGGNLSPNPHKRDMAIPYSPQYNIIISQCIQLNLNADVSNTSTLFLVQCTNECLMISKLCNILLNEPRFPWMKIHKYKHELDSPRIQCYHLLIVYLISQSYNTIGLHNMVSHDYKRVHMDWVTHIDEWSSVVKHMVAGIVIHRLLERKTKPCHSSQPLFSKS
jgi:hypothetical protein